MRVVIIGNSATAVGAVESIRQHDQACEIVVVSEEPHGIYSRPMLSHFLAGEIDRPRLSYRPADFYSRHNVRPLLNARVTAIDVDGHSVQLATGQGLRYDKLLIATGGSPIVPPVPGIESGGVFSFTRLDETLAMLRYLEQGGVEHAVVVGGGMIGIKATDALVKRGLRVTLVELAPRILSAALDETSSRLMTRVLNDAGVEVVTQATVVAIHAEGGEGSAGEPRIAGVTLDSGRDAACQMLVFGIGVRPNASLAKEAGIAVNRGVVVDEYMRTSAPDVYAAGDVASFPDPYLDRRRRVEHEDAANSMGRVAGQAMAGGDSTYDYSPMFYSDMFDLGYEAVGRLDSRLETDVAWEEPFHKGVITYIDEGKVAGVLNWNVWDQVDQARERLGQPVSAATRAATEG